MSIFDWIFSVFHDKRKEINRREYEEEKDKECSDDEIFEKIFEQVRELYIYRYTNATKRINELERTDRIYRESKKFRTDKYADIIPAVRDFGEKYKNEIPAGGARSEDAKKLTDYREGIKELKALLEEAERKK